jgi:hypothetical protein
MFWTPAFAGVTLQGTFYEAIKFPNLKYLGSGFGFLVIRIKKNEDLKRENPPPRLSKGERRWLSCRS